MILPKRIVTLDFDGTTIRLLEIRGKRVVRWASAPIGLRQIAEGTSRWPRDLGLKAKELMKSSGIKGALVGASIAGMYPISRVLPIPGGGKRQSRGSVHELVEAAMPTKEVSSTWQVLKGKDTSQVFVVAIPKNVLKSQLKSLRLGGITPKALETKALALARTVNTSEALFVNVEPSTLETIVIADGIPQIMHTSAFPDDASTDGIVERINTTVELAVSSYNSAHPETTLGEDTPLFVVGEATEDPELLSKVLARTRFRLEAFAPPFVVPRHFPLSSYAVNLGLALRGTAQPKSDGAAGTRLNINLLNAGRKPKTISWKTALSAGGILVALVLVLFLYNTTSGAISKTSELQGDLDAVVSAMNLRRDESRRLAEMETKIREYESIMSQRGYFTDLVALLDEVAEDSVELRTIVLSRTSVGISGVANSYSNIIAFTNALRSLDEFSKVDLPSISSEGGDFGIMAVPK